LQCREVRLDLPAGALLADVNTDAIANDDGGRHRSGNNTSVSVWRDIVEKAHAPKKAFYVVWMTPDIFVTSRRGWIALGGASAKAGFRDAWHLRSESPSPFFLAIYSRQEMLETTQDQGRQVMDAILRHFAGHPGLGDLKLRASDAIDQHTVRPSEEGLRALVGAAPSSPRTVSFIYDFDESRRKSSAPSARVATTTSASTFPLCGSVEFLSKFYATTMDLASWPSLGAIKSSS
jgi:hypothetical protein